MTNRDAVDENGVIDRASKDYIKRIWPERRPLAKAIRDKCMDCTGDQPSAIRECPSTNCPLWPYRMGRDPYRTGPGFDHD